MSYFLLGAPYEIPLETRASVHGTLQNAPKACPLMLTPGWRWVCGGNDIWIGSWQTEDMNKRAGHNPSAFWHLPAGCSYSLVPEENWLAFPSSTVESLVPSSVYLRGLQGLSFLLDTFLQSLSLFPVSHLLKPFFSHLCLPHITSILSFSKHPSQRLLRVWIWRNPRRAAAWPTIGNILSFISHIPHPTSRLISDTGNTWPAVLFGGATLPVVKASRKMEQNRREYDCLWRWPGVTRTTSLQFCGWEVSPETKPTAEGWEV